MTNKEPEPDEGIFLVEGSSLSISNISFRIEPDGKITTSPVEIGLRIDVCPIWFAIAFEQVQPAKAAADEIQAARERHDDAGIGTALKHELHAGLQSIVAAGIALDAFYSLVKPLSGVPAATQRSWSKNRTARYKQMAETFKVAFALKQNQCEQISDILKDVLAFRDMAVHPDQITRSPALHPELNKMVDRRFAIFRFYNSREILKYSLAVVVQLARREIAGDLEKVCQNLLSAIESVHCAWDKEFGPLIGREVIGDGR